MKVALRFAAVAGLLFLLARLIGVLPGPPREAAAPPASGPGSAAGLEALEIPEEDARQPDAAAMTAADRDSPAEESELLALLREVARAHAASDVDALETALEALLGDVRDAIAVVDLAARLDPERDPEALLGAVLTLVSGVTLYHQPGWPRPEEGPALLDLVLAALPDVPMPWLESLVEGLADARAGERAILDLEYLPRILALRAEHPELAPVFSRLLEHVADDLEEPGGFERLHALLLGDTGDPTTVGLSLSALLADRPEAFLPIAEEMHARAGEDRELASAITQAIAAGAPVDSAASALARMTDGSEILEFQVLGARDGALEPLAAEYSALAAQGVNPRARAMLVSGMGAEREETLIGIAATDPDAAVRGQALLTGSLGRPVGPEFVGVLRRAHASRGDPQHGLDANASVSIAENVLRASPGAPRAEASELLLEIAADSALADRARWRAVAALRPWVGADRLRGIVIGGKAVE